MDTKTIKFKFSGRRELSPSRKRTMFIYGIVLILIGLLVLFKFGFETNSFWTILAIGGILNILHGLVGKELIKETNHIVISPEEIEYKNSFKKSRKIKVKDLLDVRIETAKVEFVKTDHGVVSYDFSVFQKKELDNICESLEVIKSNLINV